MLLKVKRLVDKNEATLIIGNNENYILKNLVLPKAQIRQKEVRTYPTMSQRLRIRTESKHPPVG
jgi:hypothetical protein